MVSVTLTNILESPLVYFPNRLRRFEVDSQLIQLHKMICTLMVANMQTQFQSRKPRWCYVSIKQLTHFCNSQLQEKIIVRSNKPIRS